MKEHLAVLGRPNDPVRPRTTRPTTPVIGRPSGGSGRDGLVLRVTRVFSFTAVIARRTRRPIVEPRTHASRSHTARSAFSSV